MYDIRPHEIAVPIPAPDDARLYFIGRIHTPWNDRKDCPRQGRTDGPECRIEIFEPWVPALQGIEDYESVEVLYWLNKARRDLIVQNPSHSERTYGTFALRSPVRPNPIGTVLAKLISVDGPNLIVRGLDCLNGTPLIDLKPDRCAFSPKAPPKP
ncbi:tRNA (N6-threonylcarbamoyladenosine(37)-N6)-methyltransferase TrmO [Roseibium salinum]|uniref:tRNA (N6-threonylcarbamoyladenosine(37)-N6)-methyltransferase TrmO n=1 Tax=Roseibium salinum TaxID=1604349 RepID=A0ABT3R5V0_9HYPH|nr:tRNA (N6-threonylcarbamoyladenosine(37)-N6)-methyltransferase TrmO [Roseibium sp. DSM 29163]MCX2724532.1 tRNA (N6-threonylcarbamoyladenosine(37)-N6)-methyltransferase TrmO [Roseibium sp. DSM 29163]MDN3721464.1 tRNA (N6-threonylcarbamoyladenosine(37)-N6)-methyltransferase TrmO [Roseibium salinum]